MPNASLPLPRGRPVDALIVGGGPAGAALAIRLAERGLRPVVVDRARFPREKACSEFLGPETTRQLGEFQILDRIAAVAAPLEGATIFGPGGAVLEGRFPAGSGQGWSLPRRILDHLLLERARAAGAVILEDAHLEDLIRDGGTVTGVVVRLSGRPVSIASRVVAGCDGLNSTVAARLGGRRREPLQRCALVAHLAGVPRLGTTAEMHVGRGDYVGLNLLGPDLANVAVVVPRKRLRQGERPEALWRKTIEAFPALRERLAQSTIVRPVLAVGPFARWSRNVVADGAILVGDAADFFDPFTGDGICTALKSASLAAPIVAAALERHPIASGRDLAPYLAARRRHFLGKWAVERLIGYAMLAPRVFNRAVDRLDRRGLGDTMIGVTAAVVPARQVLNPGFLAAMMM